MMKGICVDCDGETSDKRKKDAGLVIIRVQRETIK
jgi:hypothetical protein